MGKELLRNGRAMRANVAGNGIPVGHAFGRWFGFRLYVLWIVLKLVGFALRPLPFPKQRYAVESLADKVREGWRLGARVRAVRNLRYEEFETGGHHFHMTVPEKTASVISRWVTSVAK